MILLFDIGNTNTHVGLANNRRVLRRTEIPTDALSNSPTKRRLSRFVGKARVEGIAICSVVPRATPQVRTLARQLWNRNALVLTPKNLRGLGIDYPKPETIGPDRLANAVAAHHRFGAPAIVVDFGTAVTFDVVNSQGNYAGGIIAPGVAAMTDYLHEKTALLPRVSIREPREVVGKSTQQAMLAGAVFGYRGLIRGLLLGLKRELKVSRLPVVATGGCARLIASKMPEIDTVDPLLTLDGLRLVWLANGLEK